MKHLAVAVSLLAMPALAQLSADPIQQGLGQEIMECTATKVQLRVQVFNLQARIAALEAAAKPAPQPDTPATTPAPSTTKPAPEAPPSP